MYLSSISKKKKIIYSFYNFIFNIFIANLVNKLRYASEISNQYVRMKVAVSNPDVIGFLNLPKPPSSLTMALGSTQSVTKMSTRNLPGGKGRAAGA
jgi:hypothetical protein